MDSKGRSGKGIKIHKNGEICNWEKGISASDSTTVTCIFKKLGCFEVFGTGSGSAFNVPHKITTVSYSRTRNSPSRKAGGRRPLHGVLETHTGTLEDHPGPSRLITRSTGGSRHTVDTYLGAIEVHPRIVEVALS